MHLTSANSDAGQDNSSDWSRGVARVPPNPYQQTGLGRGGGIIRSTNLQTDSSMKGNVWCFNSSATMLVKTKKFGWDYDIKLKCGLVHQNIARFDLSFKVKSTSMEEESQVAIHRIMTDFFTYSCKQMKLQFSRLI